MAEVEIGAIIQQCLDRRVGDKETLTREVQACVRQRNTARVTIRWMFTVEQARARLMHAYRSESLC